MINRLEKYCTKNVTHKFYEDARHELFNEINREEVFKDIINWFDSYL